MATPLRHGVREVEYRVGPAHEPIERVNTVKRRVDFSRCRAFDRHRCGTRRHRPALSAAALTAATYAMFGARLASQYQPMPASPDPVNARTDRAVAVAGCVFVNSDGDEPW